MPRLLWLRAMRKRQWKQRRLQKSLQLASYFVFSEMNMGMSWCNGQTLGFWDLLRNKSRCLETVLSSAVRFGYRAKFEQFAEAQTTENHMMTTTNALTAVQENAGSSGCCFLNPMVLILSTSRLINFIISRICDVSCPEQSGWASTSLTEDHKKFLISMNYIQRVWCGSHLVVVYLLSK